MQIEAYIARHGNALRLRDALYTILRVDGSWPRPRLLLHCGSEPLQGFPIEVEQGEGWEIVRRCRGRLRRVAAFAIIAGRLHALSRSGLKA